MRVRQPTSSPRATKKSIPEIAHELNVDAVIEGSVQRSGDRVRITTQLVQTNPEKHLWSQSYERDLRDVLALQGEVAQAIANEIRVKLTPDEQLRSVTARRIDPEAYEAYLRGRYFLSRWPEGAEKPAKCFQEAIDKDPNYAEAYAGLAVSTNRRGFFEPPEQFFPRGKAAAERALQLNPNLGEAHAALAQYKVYSERD